MGRGGSLHRGHAGRASRPNSGNRLSTVSLHFTIIGGHSFLCVSGILEKPLEKKAGRNYGPGGNKKLVYFIDDMNTPEVDAYGSVQPHTLIRQHIDYGHW